MKKSNIHGLPVINTNLIFMLIVATWMLTACKEQRYMIVITNETDENIKNVMLWLDAQTFEYGTINAKSKETGIFQQHRLTPKLRITWSDFNDNQYEQKFVTNEFIPNNYENGLVHLTYRTNGQFILSYDDTQF